MNAILFLVLMQNPFDFSGDVVQPRETFVAVKAERDELRERLAQYELNPMLQLHGLSSLKAEMKAVQWVVTTSPSCRPCHQLVRQLNHELKRLNWRIGTDANDHFRINEVSGTEWEMRGLILPQAELFVNGQVIETLHGSQLDPIQMAHRYVQASAELSKLSSEQVTGLAIGTVNAKSQVASILNNLTPFLDGGTLDITYTPKPGTVKEWLTIKQGVSGIKIPAKTQIKLSINNGRLDIVPSGIKPMVIVGPLERSIDSIELSANKLSIRLPWMVDPEWNIK